MDGVFHISLTICFTEHVHSLICIVGFGWIKWGLLNLYKKNMVCVISNFFQTCTKTLRNFTLICTWLLTSVWQLLWLFFFFRK